MACEFVKLYEENPEEDKLDRIVDVLKGGGVVIYPQIQSMVWDVILRTPRLFSVSAN